MSHRLRWFVAALMVTLIVVAWLPIERRGVIAQSEKGLKSALTMYAVARGLNAVISVAQGTRVAVEPVGVGVEVAVGEALNPLQELVDQFSTAMLAAAAVLGLQILLMKLGAHWMLCACLTAAGVGAVAWWLGARADATAACTVVSDPACSAIRRASEYLAQQLGT